jgi:transposase
MIEVSQVLQCKQLRSQGASIRAISKETGISRNTVRRYLRGEAFPGTYAMKSPRPQPVRDAIRTRVRELLVSEREKETPRKQRLTAARIHRILAGEGRSVSESTVRKLVRELRLDLRDPLAHAYLPLEYEPGEDAQVDFYEGEVDDVRLGRVKVILLLVRACFSGACFAYAAPNQTREALFEGLMRAMEHFGGVFRKLWFDNLTPAVKKVLKGRTRELQEAFLAFQAHYGFEAEFCGPGKGNEKGGVESGVKYSRHEILSPIPEVAGRDDVQALCDAWMERELLRTVRGKQQTIGERWALEAPVLMPLPANRFQAAQLRSAKVSARSWIQLGTNFYSAPVEWVGREVSLELDAERVVVLGPGGDRAQHRRLYGREEMSLELDHYLPLLARKHRGLDRAVPVKRFLEREDGCWKALLGALRRREGEVEGGKAFVDVLFLCREYGVEAVAEAVRRTLRHPELSLGLVRFHLWDEIEVRHETPAAIDYPGPEVRPPSLADYADLVGSAEVGRG